MKEKWVILHKSGEEKKNFFINKLLKNIGFSSFNIRRDMSEDYLNIVVDIFQEMRINVKDWGRKSLYMSRGNFGIIIPRLTYNIIDSFYNTIMFIHNEEEHNLEEINSIYKKLILKNPNSQGLIFNIEKIESSVNTLILEGITLLRNKGNEVEEQYFQFNELEIVKEKHPEIVDQIIYIDFQCLIYNNLSKLEFFTILKDREKEVELKKEIEMLRKEMSILFDKHR